MRYQSGQNGRHGPNRVVADVFSEFGVRPSQQQTVEDEEHIGDGCAERSPEDDATIRRLARQIARIVCRDVHPPQAKASHDEEAAAEHGRQAARRNPSDGCEVNVSPAEDEESDGDHTGHDSDDLLAVHDQVIAEDAGDHHQTDHHDGGDELRRVTRTPAEFGDGGRQSKHRSGGQGNFPAQCSNPAQRSRHFGTFHSEGGTGKHHGRRVAALARYGYNAYQQERYDHADDGHDGGLPEGDTESQSPCAV